MWILHSNSGCNAACTTRHSADAGDLAWHAQARADQVSSSRTQVSEPRYRPRHQKACCFECLSWPPCCTISVHRPMLCTSYLHIGLRFPSRCVCVSSVWYPECRGRVPAASLAHSRKVVCPQCARQKDLPHRLRMAQRRQVSAEPGLARGGAPERWVLGGKGMCGLRGCLFQRQQKTMCRFLVTAFTD